MAEKGEVCARALWQLKLSCGCIWRQRLTMADGGFKDALANFSPAKPQYIYKEGDRMMPVAARLRVSSRE